MKEMIEWAREIGRPFNIAILISNSNDRYVKLICDQGGVSRAIVNKGGSRKCECPFELVGRRSRFVKWTLKVKFGMHNHEIGTTSLGHPYLGRLTPKEKDSVIACGVFKKPKEISQMLVNNNPKNVTSRKQISNFKYKVLLRDRGNLTVCQQTLVFLHNKGYRVRTLTKSETNELDILFFVHPDSLHLMKLFPYLIVMDATYKTNRFVSSHLFNPNKVF